MDGAPDGPADGALDGLLEGSVAAGLGAEIGAETDGAMVGAAVVLGSEIGTTIKILLGSLGGNASKKRVALGNLFFNIFLTVLAFALLKPILLMITDGFGIIDPLIGLVTFSTLINKG